MPRRPAERVPREDGRSGGSVGGRSRECCDDRRCGDEEQRRHSDELTDCTLRGTEPGERGSRQAAHSRHGLDEHRDGDDHPGDPGHGCDDDQGEGAVVRAGEQGAQLAEVGRPTARRRWR